MVTDREFQKRIKAGIDFMDKEYGRSWRKKIKLAEFDIKGAGSCILGQTDTDFDAHRQRLGLNLKSCERKGFILDEVEADRETWDRLNDLWKRALKKLGIKEG